ncbi:hypothetical protein M3223_15720 [Paenibacillus pasadenensis]|uniref:hypothetical protein n=1 Tax=Paenibacillus pasadenensis TaxID=217090 RepID=UPI00203F5D02|nr:hypothetical protein [Paenibacillus pasadenensis]MCM3748801.1 hypothetical protein [Paenibacillus pasadenensis]
MNNISELAAISNYAGGLGTGINVILVLFILLVIVLRTFNAKRTGSSQIDSNEFNSNAYTKRFYFENNTDHNLLLVFARGEVIIPQSSYLLAPGELDYVDVVNGNDAESRGHIRYDAFPPPPGGQSIGHASADLINRSGIGQLSFFRIFTTGGVLRASERVYYGRPILTIDDAL